MIDGLTLVKGKVMFEDRIYSTYTPDLIEQVASFAMLKGGEYQVAKEFGFDPIPGMNIAFIDLQEENYGAGYCFEGMTDTYLVNRLTPKDATHEAAHRYHLIEKVRMQGTTIEKVIRSEKDWIAKTAEGFPQKEEIISFYRHLMLESFAWFTCASLGFQDDYGMPEKAADLLLPEDSKSLLEMMERVYSVKENGISIIPELSNGIGAFTGNWLMESGVSPSQMIDIHITNDSLNPLTNYLDMIRIGNETRERWHLTENRH